MGAVKFVNKIRIISANLKTTFSSWEEQNRHEGKVLVSVTSQNDTALILGDLNCGPTLDNKSISGDFEGMFLTICMICIICVV